MKNKRAQELAGIISEAKKGEVRFGYTDQKQEDIASNLQTAAAQILASYAKGQVAKKEKALLEKLRAGKDLKMGSSLNYETKKLVDEVIAINRLANHGVKKPLEAWANYVQESIFGYMPLWLSYLYEINRRHNGSNSVNLNQGEVSILLDQNGSAKMKSRLVKHGKNLIDRA